MILSWREGRDDDICRMLDDEVVMYLPVCHVRAVGKNDFMSAFQQMRKEVVIKRYDALDYKVRTRMGVSIAHYTFRIDYDWKGKRYSESGIDFLVFVREGRFWRLIRRSAIFSS